MGTQLVRHNQDFQSTNRPINLPEPSASHHPATKNYVDNAVLSLNDPMGVKVLETSNVDIATLNNGDTVGGAVVSTNDIVFLAGQTTASQNGAYIVGATNGTTVRHPSVDTGDDARGLLIVVEAGTHAGKLAFQTANPAIIGTDGLTMSVLTPGTTYVFSQGTQESGGTVTARLNGSTLTQDGSGLKVSSTGITATELASNAVTTAKILDGNVTEAKVDTGSIARWKTFTGPASAGSTWTQAHSMGKSTLVVSVQFNSTGSTWVDVSYEMITTVDATNVVVDFGASVSDRSLYRIVLAG